MEKPGEPAVENFSSSTSVGTLVDKEGWDRPDPDKNDAPRGAGTAAAGLQKHARRQAAKAAKQTADAGRMDTYDNEIARVGLSRHIQRNY